MDLGRTQVLSLVTKAVTTALGIIQSLIVIRLLGPAHFGLVGLVVSIGGVIGVSQHLGIVDGAIREIAVLKKKSEIGKVFWVSHIVRQIVTIPLSIALILLSGVIAQRVYGRPEITIFLQLFAAALILQGLQDVLGASLTGLKKFKALYGVQIATAAINIAVFGYLTWQFGIGGFFSAVIITTSIMATWFFLIIARELRGYLAWPTFADIRQYGRRVLRVGAYMYLARIFFVVWQRLPLLLLGGVLAAEELGYLNVSATFGARLTIIAMALSEVNLSWMSSLFVHDREEFQRTAARNMQRVFMVMFALTAALIFFTPEILLVIGREFIPAEPLIYIMTFAFFLYSLTDIGTSSVFVPADQPRSRALVYGLTLVLSAAVIGWALLFKPSPYVAAWGVLLGVAVAYGVMVWLAKRRFAIALLTPALGVLLGVLAVSVLWLMSGPGFGVRFLVFAALGGYSWWEARRRGLLPDWSKLLPEIPAGIRIVGFGTAFDSRSWTNRQHVLSRLSQHYPVLYIEPREWIVRFCLRHWREPKRLFSFLWRLVGYQPVKLPHGNHGPGKLYLVSQWNLIPGSREYRLIAAFNHYLNRSRIIFVARVLGFRSPQTVLWLYETEAAEYLSAWPSASVFYDCVDDHAAQAGAERNTQRVQEEENLILQRANIVTVTSRRLYNLKQQQHSNVHLVLNAGDVKKFLPEQQGPHPSLRGVLGLPPSDKILGTVGALDAYKVDFELLERLARERGDWQIVLIGEGVVDRDKQLVEKLAQLPNVKWLGALHRDKVPAYVHQFDVCLIPYRANQYNAASFPLKFWEFMATGKPIVVGGVPELREYTNMIGYAETTEDFIRLCEEALHEDSSRKQTRRVLARDHSWEKRVEQLRELLHTIVK